MKDEIVKLRSEIVSQCNDKQEVKILLDRLTEMEIENYKESLHFSVKKSDILQKKDFDNWDAYMLTDGMSVRFKGGYDVFVDNKLASLIEGLKGLFIDSVDKDVSATDLKHFKDDVGMIMSIPIFAFSDVHLFSFLTFAYKCYLNALLTHGLHKKKNETKRDKIMAELSEEMFRLADEFAKQVEKEGLKYERKAYKNNNQRHKQNK